MPNSVRPHSNYKIPNCKMSFSTNLFTSTLKAVRINLVLFWFIKAYGRCVCSVMSDCSLMDCDLPGSSVHGISQARILEWVAISSSRGSSWPRDWTHISYIAGEFLTRWTTGEACVNTYMHLYLCWPIFTSITNLYCPCIYIFTYWKNENEKKRLEGTAH